MKHGTDHVPRRAAGQGTGRPPSMRGRRVVRVVVVDGYVNSGAGSDSGAGPRPAEIQQTRIAKWVHARGWRVGRMFDEPSLPVALGRIESRESDGLVVARVRHLGSSLDEVLTVIERIQAAGGRFVSIADGIDLNTPSGRLVLQILLSIGS